ncbi:MAG: hypothetical protein KJO54_08110 [Gammaproteobacteria bacterium]|nr:hypothetical protein [Gammaproteobacteria bacterium]NNF61082.1 hypothetical protein [Gammaproteobacteria bacterium]NNM21405.1 hypothetical protein [Gammaproteobacteria bacterium]
MHKSKLVVKPHRPRRVRVMWALLVLGALVGGFLLLEYGQYRGGFNRGAMTRDIEQLNNEIAALTAENDRLRERIALLETSLQVDHEAYNQVEDTLADLQQEIQKQREELAFYRGIVSPPDATGLQIREFQLSAGPQNSRYRVRLVLVQASKHDRRVSGVVSLTVDGAENGAPVTYALAELMPQEGKPLDFSFRYFQDLERDLVLPEHFVPDRVNVEVNPRGRGAKVIRQSYDWAVQQS